MVPNRTSAEAMAEFTFALRYEAIPPEVVAAARSHLADTLACALAAYDVPIIVALRNGALRHGGSADATIIGSADRVAAGAAALVNGAMARFCDANDIFVLPRGGALPGRRPFFLAVGSPGAASTLGASGLAASALGASAGGASGLALASRGFLPSAGGAAGVG